VVRPTARTGDEAKSLGVFHSAEIPFVFGAYIWEDSEFGEVSRTMCSAWIRFAHDLDPNEPNDASWPQYAEDTRQILLIQAGQMRVTRDDYREEALDWLANDEDWNRMSAR